MKRKILWTSALAAGLLAAAGTAAAEEAAEAGKGFLDVVADVNGAVNGVVWGVPALALLAFVGVLMTVLTKVFQVTHFGHWIRKTIGAVFSDKHVTGHTKDKSISQFQSLCTALAATVGTGNIVGPRLLGSRPTARKSMLKSMCNSPTSSSTRSWVR